MTGTISLPADMLPPLNRFTGAICMSIRLMTKVWDSGCYEGGTLLVLLALADWANDDGDRVFPKMAQIAKRARLCERQARRVLRDLEGDGVLIPKTNKTGGRGNRVEYKINLESMTKCPPLEEGGHSEPERRTFATGKADICDSERRTSTTLKGDICDNPPTPPYIDNRQENHQVSNRQENHQRVDVVPPAQRVPAAIPSSPEVQAMVLRVCAILGVELHGDPARIVWHKQLEEMLKDGLDFTKDIIPAAEVARANGKPFMLYIRSVAFNALKNSALAKEGPHESRASNYGRRSEKLSPHDKFTRACAIAAGVLDGGSETDSAAGYTVDAPIEGRRDPASSNLGSVRKAG